MNESGIHIDTGGGNRIQLGCGTLTLFLLLWLVWNSACTSDPQSNASLEAKIDELQGEVWHLRRSVEQLTALVGESCAEEAIPSSAAGVDGDPGTSTP